jgi:hypothetical protein
LSLVVHWTGRLTGRTGGGMAKRDSRSMGEGAGDPAVEQRSESPDPAPVWRRHPGTAIASVVVAFFLIRMLGEPWPHHFPPTYPDSFSYLKVATVGPFHPHFYFDERPIGYPLLLWLMGRSSALVVVAQAALYVVAFWTLCRVVFSDLNVKVVGVAAVVFIAALAIEPRNSMWNTIILSEGPSTSLAVLSIAAWWRAAARPSKRTITWAWIATAAWILIRDTNVLPTMLAIVPAALVLAWVAKNADRELRKRLVLGAVAITIVCGYVYVSQAVSHRTQYSVHNAVGMRVLPDPGITHWFVQGGMPLDAALRGRTNHNAWDDNEAFLRAPELARYRTWARGAGGRRLLISMVALAPEWWNRLHHEIPNILRDGNQGYDSYHVFDRFPHHMPAPFGTPRTPAGLWVGLLLAIAGLATAAADPRRRLLAYFAGVGLLSTVIDVWCSYVGDPMEVNRHLVGPLVRLNVFVIIAIALGADVLVSGRPHRPATEPGDESAGESHVGESPVEKAPADA